MKKTISFIITALILFTSCVHAEKKEMKSSEILKLIKKGKPVQIVDKIILDDLDFSQVNEPFLLNANTIQTEIVSNIFFSNCVFMGNVTACSKRGKASVQTVFRNNVVFQACDFRGEVNFRGATIFGTVNFNKSIFRKTANFNNIAVWAKSSYFNEIIAEQSFTMVYALFYGNVYFMDTKFQDNTNFQAVKTNGILSFNNAVFSGKNDFSSIEVSGRALFNYAVFEKDITFLQARFLQSVEFVSTKFNGNADFENAYFADSVDTKNLNNVDFSKAFFVKK